MKILFISDIHANYPALEAVWKKESDSDMILCAGDLVDWGFYPREVLDWCRTNRVIAVAGNHDHDMIRWYENRNMAELDGTIAQQNLEQLTPDDIAYLKSLPESRTVCAENFAFYLKHYYSMEADNRNALLDRWNRYESKMAFEETWPGDVTAPNRVILTGHSHQCYLYQVGQGSYFLNPGSVSYRVCSDSRAKGADYAVLQDGEFRLRHVDYDRKIFVPLIDQIPLRDPVREAVSYHLIKDLP